MGSISTAAVRSLIVDFFFTIGGFQITTMEDLEAKVMLVDDSYSPITGDELIAIAKGNPLMAPPNAAKMEITDCDDYALQLKAIATAHFRQRYFAGAAEPLPPAVAIVISGNHAVNLFIDQDARGNNSIWFMDASTPELPVTNDPAQAARLMKEPPVRLIYM